MRRLLLVLALVLAACDGGSAPAVGASVFTSPWYAPDGQPVVRTAPGYSPEVHASDGPSHCEWEAAVFLSVGWPLGTSPLTADQARQYLRDPEGAVRGVDDVLLGDLDLDVDLPDEATYSGYATADAELWFGPDGGETYAYLQTDEGVERWPRAGEAIACA